MIGAPKKAAAQAIEDLEKDARGWYGGAIGMISAQRRHQYRHHDSHHSPAGRGGRLPGPAPRCSTIPCPAQEEQETRLKATAFFRASAGTAAGQRSPRGSAAARGPGVRLLLVDNDDCFIHTLANYARQTGAEVVTYRCRVPAGVDRASWRPDLILISPGRAAGGLRRAGAGAARGRRRVSRCSACAWGCRASSKPSAASWACSITPCTAKPSMVVHNGAGVFEGLPEQFTVGRYHSLFARKETFPACLEVTAESDDGVIMGVRHRELPIEAVAVPPRSILTLEDGLRAAADRERREDLRARVILASIPRKASSCANFDTPRGTASLSPAPCPRSRTGRA